MSYLLDLECSDCGQKYSPKEINTFCPICQAPLMPRYDLPRAKQQLDRDSIQFGKKGMWRWHELLPVYDPKNFITLGEGDTALLPIPTVGRELGLTNLYVKDESSNPTGSFKARGLAVAIAKAAELGVKKVIIPTAGNAGGAMAAYAARGGLQAYIFMPVDTPRANIEESRMVGAEVFLVDGIISDAAGMAGIKAREEGWFDLSTFKEPYRVALGWLENAKRPRMVAVQAEGCAPVVKAFEAGSSFCDFWLNASTIASGLRVPKSFADHIILSDLRESLGTAIAVSDAALLKSQHQLATREGIFAAPEGAATLAALEELVQRGWVKPEERIVLFNTGTGLKYLD